MSVVEDEGRERATAPVRARDRRMFAWRHCTPGDAPMLAAIYNETILRGGHSPQHTLATVREMQGLIGCARREGWPVWSLHDAAGMVAWAWIRPLEWGTQVCRQSGSFSVYVAGAHHGSAAAMQAVLVAYELAPRHGFCAVSCWILSSNRSSLNVARAARMQPWGRLPGAANFGGVEMDVCIWGARYDDPAWTSYMDRLRERLLARSRREYQRLGAR